MNPRGRLPTTGKRDTLFFALAVIREKDDLCLKICRRRVMEAGLLMLLSSRVGDDGLLLHASAYRRSSTHVCSPLANGMMSFSYFSCND
jgi:hypothetical protein